MPCNKILILFILFSISYANLNSQSLDLRLSHKEKSSNHVSFPQEIKTSETEYSTLSLGLGLTKALKNDDYGNFDLRFLFAVNVDFNVRKKFSLNAGINIHQTEFSTRGTILDIFLLPSLKFNAFRNRISFIIGTGPAAVVYFGREGGFSAGLFTSLRTQYNLNNKLSIGMEISHPEYFGEGSAKYFILRCNFFILTNML